MSDLLLNQADENTEHEEAEKGLCDGEGFCGEHNGDYVSVTDCGEGDHGVIDVVEPVAGSGDGAKRFCDRKV